MLENNIHFLVSLPFAMEYTERAIVKADKLLSLHSDTHKIGNDIIQMITLPNEQ